MSPTDPAPAPGGISGETLRVRYAPGQPAIIDNESIHIPHGRITALIGPNGSGKSTLLKTLARQMVPESGRVMLDGRDLAKLPNRELARCLGILFQENPAPGDLTVDELVHHGRYPHRRMFAAITREDEQAVEDALRRSDLLGLRHQPLAELSSGQRQLAWIAMALAQGPDHLFLDEPTTFLDLAHQFEVMNLVRRLNRDLGRTIVLVLHDLNLAARYAHHLIAVRAGKIVVAGTPAEVLTVRVLREVFSVEARIVVDDTGTITCIPLDRAAP